MAPVTKEECEQKHGVWRWVIGIAVGLATAIGAAAFGFAFQTNREVGEVQVKSDALEKRLDRVERAIDEGFDRVIRAFQKGQK